MVKQAAGQGAGNILFLFDVDGTLIRENKETDYGPLADQIAAQKKKGALFGLATSRPWQSSRGIYERLKLNGPGVFENGTYYKLNKRSKRTVIGGEPDLLKKRVAALCKIYSTGEGRGVALKISDDKSLLLKERYGLLFLVSRSRKYGCSLYIRERGRKNRETLLNIHSFLKKNLGSKYLVRLESAQGKITIADAAVTKVSTVELLARIRFKGMKIVLISDNEQILPGPSRVTFCAVRHAVEEYKGHCQFIATEGGLAGVSEIIKTIKPN